MTKDCPSTSTCKKCHKNHNTWLHADKVDNSKSKTIQETNLHHSSVKFNSVLLPTAVIPVVASDGSIIQCRALLDSGAQLSMITEECTQNLKLKRTPISIQLNGIVSSKFVSTSSVDFEIRPTHFQKLDVKALVRPKLTEFLPSQSITNAQCFHAKSVKLADPDFLMSRRVDILGSDIYESIVLDGKLEEENGLHLWKTIFGWVVSGKLPRETTSAVNSVTILKTDIDLRRFWEIEEVHSPKQLTAEEMQCEQHFLETTQEAEDARFKVKLPFKPEVSKLGESFTQARRRFMSLERRLIADPELHERYRIFIREFMDLGHLEEVPLNEIDKDPSQLYYLPHHCVFKEESTTTKLRVVFDGSAKTSTGQSLNESLMVGAKLQSDLYSTLLRFRLHKVALSGDIAKMYRQIALADEDKDFHRILWRDSPSEPLKHLRMTRVTYGIASSSYHSIRCLQEVGKKSTDEAVKLAIFNDFSVDDFIGGAPDKDTASSLVHQLIAALKKHGFELRKWTSSDSSITLSLPEKLRETEESSKILDKDYHMKTLGIRWNPNPDTFTFNVTLDAMKQHTKRTLLSDVSKLFDPSGWLGPVIIRYKGLLQKLWILGIDWYSEW